MRRCSYALFPILCWICAAKSDRTLATAYQWCSLVQVRLNFITPAAGCLSMVSAVSNISDENSNKMMHLKRSPGVRLNVACGGRSVPGTARIGWETCGRVRPGWPISTAFFISALESSLSNENCRRIRWRQIRALQMRFSKTTPHRLFRASM